MEHVRDVADGEHVGVARAEARHRSSRRCRPRAPRPRRARCSGMAPMPTTTMSAGTSSPPSISTPGRRGRPRRRRCRPRSSTCAASTPCSRCRSPKTAPAVVADRDVQRDRLEAEHGDVVAVAPRGRGDLEADPSGADDHDAPPAGRDGLAQRDRIVDRAQQVHAGEVGARPAEPARRGAGREQQPVVGAAPRPSSSVTVCAAGSSALTRRPRRTSTRCSVVPGRGMHVDRGAVVVAEQELLRQRRPDVRASRLRRATMHDRPVVARLPCALGRPRAGESAADDDEPDRRHSSHASVPRRPQRARNSRRVAIVVAHGADERARRRARSLAPARRAATCTGARPRAPRPRRAARALVDPLGDLPGQPLLHLQVAREQLDDARELRQPDEAVAGHVADVRDAAERQQVVLAQRVERDVGDDDEFVVALVVRERRRGERLRASAARSTRRRPGGASRRGAAMRMSRPSAVSSASTAAIAPVAVDAAVERLIGRDRVQPSGGGRRCGEFGRHGCSSTQVPSVGRSRHASPPTIGCPCLASPVLPTLGADEFFCQ